MLDCRPIELKIVITALSSSGFKWMQLSHHKIKQEIISRKQKSSKYLTQYFNNRFQLMNFQSIFEGRKNWI